MADPECIIIVKKNTVNPIRIVLFSVSYMDKIYELRSIR